MSTESLTARRAANLAPATASGVNSSAGNSRRAAFCAAPSNAPAAAVRAMLPPSAIREPIRAVNPDGVSPASPASSPTSAGAIAPMTLATPEIVGFSS